MRYSVISLGSVYCCLAYGLRESNAGKGVYSEIYEEAVKNTRTYAGREPTRLEEWVVANKAAFV